MSCRIKNRERVLLNSNKNVMTYNKEKYVPSDFSFYSSDLGSFIVVSVISLFVDFVTNITSTSILLFFLMYKI